MIFHEWTFAEIAQARTRLPIELEGISGKRDGKVRRYRKSVVNVVPNSIVGDDSSPTSS